MKTEIQRLTDIRWQSSQFAHQALELSSRNSQITLQVFQVTDSKQIDALMAERQENSDQISALLTQVAGMVNSDEERQLIEAIIRTRRSFVKSDQLALNLLLHESRLADARQEMWHVTMPQLLLCQEIWEKFVTYQSDQIAKSGAALEARYNHVRHRSLLSFSVGVLLALNFAGVVVLQLLYQQTLIDRYSQHIDQVQQVLKSQSKSEKLWVETVLPHRPPRR